MAPKKNSFSRKLREFRTAAGLSQAEVGKILKVSDKLISHWERGVSEPSLDALARLATVLGRSVDELLDLEGVRERMFPPWVLAVAMNLASLNPKGREAVEAVIRAFAPARPPDAPADAEDAPEGEP